MSRRPIRSVQAARRSQTRRPNFEMLEVRELLTGFSVTTVADNGDNINPTAGSLRAEILAANTDPTVGADSITFNLPGSGVQTIAVPTSLPAITRTVLINATSASDGSPLVVIDGSGAGAGASGLIFSTSSGSVVHGLSIVGFATNGGAGGAAIDLQSGSGNESIEGNYIGIEPDGSTAKANNYGIVAFSSNNTIGGSVALARNLISGNKQEGVFLLGGATGNQVIGNYIGTNAAGTVAVGNLHGVVLAASGNTIGGTTSGTANLISGNVGGIGQSGVGVLFEAQSTSNVVEGNKIGTDVTGMSAVPNLYGVYFGTPTGSTSDNIVQETIGGTVTGAGNLISGNGIGITGNATAVLIAGNTIGLNVNGNSPLANGDGVLLGANGSTIGGTTATARNVISGNSPLPGVAGTGLDLSGAGDLILGNYIGLTSTGVGGTGIGNVVGLALHAIGTTIGGTTTGSGNLISGNKSDAIELDDNGTNGVFGNVIGLNALGAALPNAGNGIALTIAAPATTPTAPLALNDTIGGTTGGTANLIAGNGGAGIVVNDNDPTGITGLSIRGNSIFANAKLGIDLNGNGIIIPSTLFITADGLINGQLKVVGVFYGAPSTSYGIDIFADGADSSGYGQGAFYLGSVTVTTNLSGFALFSPSFTPPSTPYTSFSATATGPNSNTSEFAANFPTISNAPQADLTVVSQSSPASIIANNSVTFTETVINNGPSTASNVMLTDTLPISLVNGQVTTTAGTATINANNVVTANLGLLAAHQSVTVKITVVASQPGVFFDSPGVASTTFDPSYDNNQTQSSITVQPSGSGPVADLGITEIALPSPVKVGANLTYVVTVTNYGPNIATNPTINDFLPTSVRFVSAIPSQGFPATLNGNLLTENLGSIGINASATFTIVVVPTVAGPITNAANVSGNQFDPVSGNNSTSLTTTVSPLIPNINLNISQTASATTGLVGQNQTFTITVFNSGTDAATNVTVVDALPNIVFNYVSATPSQGGPAVLVNHSLVDNLGTIAPGASATFTLIVAPTTPGLFINGGFAFSQDAPSAPTVYANNAIISIPSGPSVIGISGHNNNSSLTITFDEPLNSQTATNKANYKLVALGKNGKGPAKTIKIVSANYNSTNHSVTIVPSSKLDPKQSYQIQVIGATKTGIADIYGRRLVNPQYSTPGANFSATFFAGTFPQS